MKAFKLKPLRARLKPYEVLKRYASGSLYFVLLLFITWVQACKEDENTPPQITINSPSSGAIVNAGDTLSVGLFVTDDNEVSSLNISLLNEELQPVAAENIPINTQEKEVLTAFVIDDLTLPSGEYVLLVTAYDSELSSKASVALKVKAAKRRLSNYVLWSSNQVFTYDTDFNLLSSASIDGKIQELRVKDSERGYLIHLEGDVLQYRDVTTNERIWSSNEISTQDPLVVSSFHYDRFFTYAAHSNGLVYKIDNLGRLVLKKSDWLHPLLYTNDDMNEVLSLSSESLRASDKGTLAISSFATPIPDPQLIFSDQEGTLYVYSSSDGTGTLFSSNKAPYRRFEKVNALLDDLDQVTKGVAAETSQFLLQEGVVWQVRSGTVERVAGINQGARDFLVNRVNGDLLILYPDELVRYRSEVSAPVLKNGQIFLGMALVYNF